MKDIPRVGFVCTGENALELSGAICCAGRFMRLFTENGYMTGGCYSCISPSRQRDSVQERLYHMCACNDVVVNIGCDGFRKGDVIPDIINSVSDRDLPYFSYKLSSEEYIDAETGKKHRCFPSRSVATICGKTVVLSVPAELPSSLGKLNSLLSAIGFAISNDGEKAPSGRLDFENLMDDFYVGRNFQD